VAGPLHWARLEELGQLRVSDVREEDGVPYLAIEPGDGKRVKTKSSRRRVPLHPELVNLGFLDFKAKQETSGEVRLFPELKGTRFSLTAAWSKYWGRHARSLGITDPRKVMHSFRHGWKTAARSVMSEELHDAITGHSNGSVGRAYGNVPLKPLADAMAKIRFEGISYRQ
jgi:integrase